MVELLVFLYAVAFGFVAAGIASSLHQLITARPPSFAIAAGRWSAVAISVVIFAFTGPMLVFRTVVAGRLNERKSLAWTAAGVAISGLWSFVLGLLLLDIMLALIPFQA